MKTDDDTGDHEEHTRTRVVSTLQTTGPCSVGDLVARSTTQTEDGLTSGEVRRALLYMERAGFVARSSEDGVTRFRWNEAANRTKTMDLSRKKNEESDGDVEEQIKTWTSSRKRVSRLIDLEAESIVAYDLARSTRSRQDGADREERKQVALEMALQVLIEKIETSTYGESAAERVQDAFKRSNR